jgi:hypothetical protein
VLTEWSELVDDFALSQSLVTLRDQLFRDGLNGVRRTYLAEAGNVDIADQNLTDEMRALLSSITCGPVTLLDEVEAWIAAGIELGQVERERVQLANEDSKTISAGEMSKVRAQWAKVTNALLTNLDMAGDSVDADTLNRILQPLKDAEKKQTQAARRRAAAKEKALDPRADEALNAPLATDAADTADAVAIGTGEA